MKKLVFYLKNTKILVSILSLVFILSLAFFFTKFFGVRIGLAAAPQNTVKAYRTTNFAVPLAIFTNIPLDGERWDTNNMHDNATNNDRLVAKSEGFYIHTCTLEWDANASAFTNLISLVKKGVVSPLPYAWDSIDLQSNAINGKQSIATLLQLNPNDYTACQVLQASGGSLDIERQQSTKAAEGSLTKIPVDSTGTKGTARATRTGSQSIPSGVWTTVNYDSERFDTANIHDNSVNNNRLTAKANGYYFTACHAMLEEFINGFVGIRILRQTIWGPVNIIAQQYVYSPYSSAKFVSVETMYKMTAEEHLTCQVYQSSGSNKNLEKASEWSPEFMLGFLGDI